MGTPSLSAILAPARRQVNARGYVHINCPITVEEFQDALATSNAVGLRRLDGRSGRFADLVHVRQQAPGAPPVGLEFSAELLR